MKTLHLGVINKPYSGAGGRTTADVAQFLENKYGVMGAFMRRHGQDVKASLAASAHGALRNAISGHNSGDPYAAAMSEITALFQNFLTNSEIEGMGIDGVPTKAALTGVSHRFKGGFNKGKGRKGNAVRRPSFINTGLYRDTFRSWVD